MCLHAQAEWSDIDNKFNESKKIYSIKFKFVTVQMIYDYNPAFRLKYLSLWTAVWDSKYEWGSILAGLALQFVDATLFCWP